MVSLKREVGLLGIVAVGVGTILGAGIYALIGVASAYSGNMLWASFLLATFIATFTGLSYVELSSKYPLAGGEYSYVSNIISKPFGTFIGIALVLAACFSVSVISVSFSGYFSHYTSLNPMIISFIFLLFICFVNYSGIKFTIGLNILFTFLEVLGLIVVIAVGAKYLGKVDYFELPPGGFQGVLSAAGIIFFAFLGFEDIVNLGEETKNASSRLPIAIILSIAITSVLYVLIALVAVSVLPISELSTQSAPLTAVVESATGKSLGAVFTPIALSAMFNTALLMFLAGTRILYAMGKEASVPKCFGRLSLKRNTPHLAIILLGAISFCLIMIQDLGLLAQLTDIIILGVFGIVNITVLVLSKKELKVKGYTLPLRIGKYSIIPIIGAITSLSMLVITLLEVFGIHLF